MLRMLIGFWLGSILLLAQEPGAQPTHLQLFLLAGQSNMAGRGPIEPQDREPIARVYMLTKDLAWAPAVDPIHFDKPIAAAGLARSFAKVLAQADPGAQIGLIPCAMGGSALDEWIPGGKLYTEAVRRTRAAMRSGTLRGILWHQGESDMSNAALATTYRARWRRFIEGLREDLDAWDVPVVVGELGEFLYSNQGKNPFALTVNEQLATIPLYVRRTAFVSSAGLRHKGDRVHFDTPSLREFGRRYALAFMSLDPGWGAPGAR